MQQYCIVISYHKSKINRKCIISSSQVGTIVILFTIQISKQLYLQFYVVLIVVLLLTRYILQG